MVFHWLKHRRREKILATPNPDNWDQIIRDNVHHVRHLMPHQQEKLRRLVPIFVAEKNWEGCGGLILTEEIKVTIAAQACLLVVGIDEDWLFEHVLSILVYATGYVAPASHASETGMVIDAGQPRLGEAWWQGPVILSWADALAGGRMESPGSNLVLHEFDQLVEDCRSGHRGIIDCCGAKNPAEFFAVLTEKFFEHPVALRHAHEEAYGILRDFYGLDPAEWHSGSSVPK